MWKKISTQIIELEHNISRSVIFTLVALTSNAPLFPLSSSPCQFEPRWMCDAPSWCPAWPLLPCHVVQDSQLNQVYTHTLPPFYLWEALDHQVKRENPPARRGISTKQISGGGSSVSTMKTQLTVLGHSIKGNAIFHIHLSLLSINKYAEGSRFCEKCPNRNENQN